MGRDKDGALNEEYCKWCYADGTYTYTSKVDRTNIKSVTLEVFFMFREERYIQIKMELLIRQRCYTKTFGED